MTSPFQYFPTSNFPMLPDSGREWNTNMQPVFPDENIGDDAQSIVKYTGQSDFRNYHRYQVRHETVREAWIRIERMDRRKVVFVEEFPMFAPEDFSFLMIKAKHKIANELLKRIANKYGGFEYSLRTIDLINLKNDLPDHIKGGWFKDLEIEDVSTAAIFGDNVSDSDEWDRYSTFGTLSSLVVEFSYKNAKHTVNLSQAGSITLYSNYNDAYALGLVEKFNKIVTRYQTIVEPKVKRPKGLKKKA